MRITLSIVLFFILGFTAFGVTTNPSLEIKEKNFAELTIGDYVGMKFKEYKKISPVKLKFKDRINFIVSKKILKNQVKQGTFTPETTLVEAARHSDSFQMNWGGFALGFLLGLIGTLIVALAFKKPRKNAVLSSLIGVGVILALVLIL